MILLLNFMYHTVCDIEISLKYSTRFSRLNFKIPVSPKTQCTVHVYIYKNIKNPKNISFLKNNRIKLSSNALKYHKSFRRVIVNGKYIINDINTYLLCGFFFSSGSLFNNILYRRALRLRVRKLDRVCASASPSTPSFFIARGGIFSELPRARLIGQKVAVLYL